MEDSKQVALNRLYYERKESQSAKQQKNTQEQKAGSDPFGSCGFRRVRMLFTRRALTVLHTGKQSSVVFVGPRVTFN